MTEEQHRPSSYDKLKNPEPELQTPQYPKYRNDFSCPERSEPQKSLNEQVNEVLENMVTKQNDDQSSYKSGSNRMMSPIIDAISNFNLAKKLHKENLEHDPLPDTITDSIYRKLQMQRHLDKDPGLMLDDKNFACAVGWKGYPGYGPNRCVLLIFCTYFNIYSRLNI